MKAANLLECALQTIMWVTNVLISIGSILILEGMERRHNDCDAFSVTHFDKALFMALGLQVS